MKVFRKKKREIIIDGHAFSQIVNETATHVKVRCYSLKSTYIEVIFNWGIATWAINFYQPSVVSTMIQYAIKLGWKYQLKNQIIVVPANESEQWAKDAGIIIDCNQLIQYPNFVRLISNNVNNNQEESPCHRLRPFI